MTARTILVDLETYSEANLKTTGAHRYARDTTTGVHCLAWLDLSKPVTGLHDVNLWTPGDPLPDFSHSVLVAHNAGFERAIFRHVLTRPEFGGWDASLADPEQWRDTMIVSAYWGGPMDLYTCGVAYGGAAKDVAGHRLMMKLCKPASYDADGNAIWHHRLDPSLLTGLYEYCRQDVLAERVVWTALPPVPDATWAEWAMDQRMNDRGMEIDPAFVDTMAVVVNEELLRVGAEFTHVTGLRVTQTKAFAEWLDGKLRNAGHDGVASVNKETLGDLVTGDTAGEPLVAAQLRLEAAKSSTAKLKAMTASACSDHRIRGMFQFGGAARTFRWAGRLAQPQNFPRGVLSKPAVKLLTKALEQGASAPQKAVEAFREFSPVPPLAACSSLLRACFVPRKGRALYVVDFSQIEARLLAWEAGQHDILAVFGRGEDVYTYTAGRLGSGATRQLGKTTVLSCFGPDTLVLTKRGGVAICSVTKTDEVWDGVEWVKQDGPIFQGMKETISLAGVEVTADHRVLCGRTWLPASDPAHSRSILHRALATASTSLLLPAFSSGLGEGCTTKASWSSAIVARQNTSLTGRTCERAGQALATSALRTARRARKRLTQATPMWSQTPGIAAVCLIACLRSIIGATTRSVHSLPLMAGVGSPAGGRLSTGHLASGDAEHGDARCLSISSPFRAGISRIWNWIGKTTAKVTGPETSGSSLGRSTWATGAPWRSSSSAFTSLKPRLPVYDLLNCGPRNRFTILTDQGPLIVHNCGYGLGPSKFQKLCKLGGIRLDEARAKETVYGWREANPMIVDFWKALERGFQEACADVPYRIESVAGNPMLGIKVIRSFAKGVPVIGIRLPSGRHLVYRQPRQVREIDDRTGTVRWRPGFMGVDPLTKRWTQLTTFGGELAGHYTQATARELMADLMMRVERFPRFEIVGTVHDEIVCEGPDADHDENLALLLKLAKTPPSWAKGLPVNAEGWWGYRYGK